MKKYLTVVIAIVLVVSGCRSAMFFDSPNSLRNISGRVFLQKGDTIEGRMIINTEGAFASNIKVVPNGEKETMRIPLQEVKGYEARGSYYDLKEIRAGLGIGRNISFMKRLTPAEGRMHLYEHMERQTTTDRNNATSTRYIMNYYLQLPNDKTGEVWALNGSKLTPNFDEKMSKIVADCAPLAKKIAAQEPGYFYRQVSLFNEKRADVLLNIISEYNQCKTQ